MGDKKRQIAINTHLWFPIVIFAIFVLIAISCAAEQNTGAAIGFFMATLLPLFAFLVSPMYYVFSEESVEVVYLWGQKEEIEWDSIKSIHLLGSWVSRGDASPHFHIAYPTNKKRLFFMNGDISKTGKTKKLIKKYYKKDVE